MRWLAIAVLVGLAVVLQLSLLPGLRIMGVVPNVALVVMVLVALRVPTSEALVAAAVGGLILDIASGANFGLWTGVFVLLVLIVGLMHRSGIELDRLLIAVGLVAAGTLVMSTVILGSLAMALPGLPVWSVAGRWGLELVLNVILTMALFPLANWMLFGGQSAREAGMR